MDNQERLIAACGLDCTDCDIRLATTNVQLAMDIAQWFKHERKEDVPIERIRCDGCSGDREHHWAADCWILKCCIDGKGLNFCYECTDFPCAALEQWAGGSERYGKALERLKGMRW
jgi:hypothetical protein